MQASLAACVLAALAWLTPLRAARRAGQVLFAAGFVGALAAWLLRLVVGRHIPLQTLYDVFLTLAVLMYPLAILCRRLAGPTPGWADPLLAAMLLAPVAMFLPPQPRPLPPALDSWLFIPHVGAYLLGYVLLLKAGLQAGAALLQPAKAPGMERTAYRLVVLGFPPLTIGLVLGAWWGQRAWGDWWNWDPKELWSLASWLAFLLYLHVRRGGGAMRRYVGPALLVAGGVLIVVTLVWVNLSTRFGGLHTYAG